MNRLAERIGLKDSAERSAFAGVVVALAIVLLVGLYFGLQRTDREIGSNAMGVGAPIAGIGAGDQLCIRDVHVPADTGRLYMWLAAPQPNTKFDVVFVAPDKQQAVAANQSIGALGYQFVKAPDTPWDAGLTRAVCLIGKSGMLQVGGASLNRYPGQQAATFNGKPIGANEPSVHFYTAAADRPLQISQTAKMFAHSSAFHGPLYPWLMLLTLLFALVATGVALRFLITAQRHPIKKLALVFMLASFAWCLSWSVMSPPFQGNDESEHFANVEYVTANHGKMWSLSATRNPLPPYSSHESLLMRAVHHNAVVVDGVARPFWNTDYSPNLGRYSANADRGNGGGLTAAGTGHGPIYYLTLAPFYWATQWMQPANQLVVLRAVNSVAASLVALFAVLSAGLLLGDRRKMAAATAGALVAFLPMFSYVSGAVNNDTWVNAFAALLLYLLLLLARKGWTVRREVAIGVVSVGGVLGKGSGASSAILAAMIVTLLVLRDRSLRAVRGGLTVLGAVIATSVAWLMIAAVAGWPRLLAYRHTEELPSPPAWIPSQLQRLDYIIQQVFPFIHLTGPMVQVSHAFERIYIVGVFGDFFWHRESFPIWTYKLIFGLMILIFLVGAVGVLLRRRWVLKNWVEFLTVVLQPVVVYFFVEYAYATPGGRSVLAEQGRYIFPALAAVAVIMASAGFGLPKKLRAPAWGLLVGAVAAFAIVSWFFASYRVYA